MISDRNHKTEHKTRARRALAAFSISLSLCSAVVSLLPSAALAHLRHRTHAHYVSRGGSPNRSLRALMSRGAGFSAPASAPVVGRVGLVTGDNVPIYAGREQFGRLLSNVDNGQTIIVTGETDQYYAVAMKYNMTGFIAKPNVQLQDAQITASGAQDASGGTQSGVAPSQVESPLAQGILQSAWNYLGIAPYVWGGNTMAGIDCSGFVKAVYAQNGITLPRTAAQQAGVGYSVPLRDLTQWQPGDRMYFQCHHDYIDHTAMYIGNGLFIHSSIEHHGVGIDKVQTAFYWNHLVAVRRSQELVASAGNSSQPSVAAPDYESNQE